MSDNNFYVGYLPMPAGVRSSMRVVVAVAVLLLAGVAVLVANTQTPAGTGTWSEDTTTFEGTLTKSPYAMLHGTDPEEPAKQRSFLLFASGKTGVAERAEKALSTLAQQRVRIRGQLLRRGSQLAITLVDGPNAIEVLGDADPIATSKVDERVHVVGEIIDPKCWLGAMKPGSGLVHKACAELCIRGGIAPCFIGSVKGQPPQFFVLTDEDGNRCNDAVASRAGTLLSLKARPATVGGFHMLRVELDSIFDEPDNR